MPKTASSATLLATLVVVSVVGSVVGLSAVASPVSADEHTLDTATDYTEEANFTVALPFTTDHYPGDQNTENGSIRYSAVGEQAMREVGAEEGAYLSYVIISADFIDYSACSTDNTAVFGLDRGDDDPGTNVDEDLVSRMKTTNFRDDGLTISFYNWEDFGGDPPYGAPDDQIVAEQGARSSGGACLTMTDEPGWYQLQGFLNGTEADNGPDQQPSEDAKEAGILAQSNYIYVCECNSEAEAREELGRPPGEEPAEETPTPTPTSTATTTPTPTPTQNDDSTPTPTQNDDSTPTPAESDDSTPTPTQNGGGGGDGEESNRTPTPGAGPGFGVITALLAVLLGNAALYRYRDK